MKNDISKMKIGIIGTGNIGATLIRKLRKAGHDVEITNSSGIESMRDLSVETGAVPVAIDFIAKDKNVVIISIPTKAILELPKNIFQDASKDLIVVDTSNYYPMRDNKIPELENGEVESVWVSKIIGRPVVKAFNAILAGALVEGGRATGSPERIAIPFAGNDLNAKKVISQLIDEVGFDPVDTGSLEDSWRQQPGSPVYCTACKAEEILPASQRAKKDILAVRREEGIIKFSSAGNLSWQATSQMNRDLTAKD